MAETISNVKELTEALESSAVKTLSYTEELERINKIKVNLGILYFAALSILMTTLFI